jgi:hypothetical protein
MIGGVWDVIIGLRKGVSMIRVGTDGGGGWSGSGCGWFLYGGRILYARLIIRLGHGS